MSLAQNFVNITRDPSVSYLAIGVYLAIASRGEYGASIVDLKALRKEDARILESVITMLFELDYIYEKECEDEILRYFIY